ncbi:multidrug effflux MFS transporter [Brucellaceae bacterium C25G]
MTSEERTYQAGLGVACALGFITLLGPASIDMYLPSLPVMANELGSDYTIMQLTLTVFLIAMGGGQLLFGPVIDALGRRLPLLIAIVAFILTSVWAAYAFSTESLITARFFQGLSASLALVTAMSSVRDVANGARATQIFALLMTIQGLGPVIAPALGGLIGQGYGWRMVFLVLSGLGILVFVSSLIMLPESLPKEKRTKLQPGSVALTYKKILSDSNFLTPALALTVTFVFLFGYIGGSAFTYQETYGLSASSFGFVFGATGFAVLLGAMLSARLVTRINVERLALIGSSTILFGAVIACISAMSALGLHGIVVGMFISLSGLGIAETALMSVALATRDNSLGSSAAILGAAPLMLGAIATPLAAYLAVLSPVAWISSLSIMAIIGTLLSWKTMSQLHKNNC